MTDIEKIIEAATEELVDAEIKDLSPFADKANAQFKCVLRPSRKRFLTTLAANIRNAVLEEAAEAIDTGGKIQGYCADELRSMSEITRIRRKFRCLRGWKIRFDSKSEYKGQCSHDRKGKCATIFDFPGEPPIDYALHEILHIVFEAFRAVKGGKQRRQFEEEMIQDICSIMEKKD